MIEFLMKGGPVMVPIGLAALIGMFTFFERLWALRRGAVMPRGFCVELEDLMRQARWDDGRTLCRKNASSIAGIMEVAVAWHGEGRDRLKERLEEAGRREAAALERYTGILGIVASVAPLLGLLGTVWGMILTFDVIQEVGVGVVSSLAGGISQALITTFAGLTVGIPALIAHRYLLSRADELLLEMEGYSIDMLELVAGREPAEPDGQGGRTP
ncbi:MAG: MotA/TolQ/ExbB proton channel family protein [Pseudomonadota bacterium]